MAGSCETKSESGARPREMKSGAGPCKMKSESGAGFCETKSESGVGSCEYRTVVSCTKPLETALRALDRDMVHFLHQEGFITQEVHDDVMNPRSMLNSHQKAGELVTGIRNKVELSAQNYHTLVHHLRQSGKQCESLVGILDSEYSRQQQAGKLSAKTLNIGTWIVTSVMGLSCLLTVCIQCFASWLAQLTLHLAVVAM